MNNYHIFLTNFVQNFGIFYISRKFNNFFAVKSDRIVSWNYIGRIKMPENFIEKYHKKIKIIVLHDYSEDFIKNKLFNYDIKIDNNVTFDYSIFKKYSEEFVVFLIINAGKINLSSNLIFLNYPFSYDAYNKYSVLCDERFNHYKIQQYINKSEQNYLNISNFNVNDIEILIEKFKKINANNDVKYYRILELIMSFLIYKKINKKLRTDLIKNHCDFMFYDKLLKYQYLTPEEIKLMKKILKENNNNNKSIIILQKYFSE